MAYPIKAYDGSNSSVIYEYQDGRTEEWSSGSRTWRDQNAGNIIYNKNNDWVGQIGKAGPFCVFSDAEYGRRASGKILSNHARQKKTLAQSIATYAPPNENNTDQYIRNVESWTGISRNTLLSSLSEDQLEAASQAIFRMEGWEVGKVTILKPPASPQAGKYIWRTAQDEKVRTEHAEREGKTFDFAKPPKGGNPGEDYNCRCSAEIIPQDSLGDIIKKRKNTG